MLGKSKLIILVIILFASCFVYLRVLAEPFCEIYKLALAYIINAVRLISFGIELERWIASYLKSEYLINRTIKLRNDQFFNILDFFGEVGPSSVQGFAILAPGSVNIDKNIFGDVHYIFIPRISYNRSQPLGGLRIANLF